MENTNARIHLLWQHKLCALVAAVLFACPAQAQLSLKRQKMDSIAARYSGEHAVYLEDSRTMTIFEEGGQLRAKSTVVAEKLFISEKSLNTYNKDRIQISSAFTYVDEAGANAFIPYKNDYKMVWNADKDGDARLTYTGLTKGSITRTFFNDQMEDLHMLPSYYFANNIPTLSAYFEVRAPRHVKMGFLLKGSDTSMIKRSVKADGANIIYRFTATNLPALKNYGHVQNTSYYQTHVLPYIISFRMTGAKKDSVISGTKAAHGRHEFDFVHGLNYKTDSFLNRKALELTKGAYSDREKLNRIFDWVQKNFHYESWYTDEWQGFVPNPADTVCKRMYGDCKDMSSIIVAMSQKVGLEAYYAVIGTDDKPYTHDEIYTQKLYNHMIAAVKIDGEWVFPDGTTHVQPLGADRSDIQNKEAMILLDAHRHEIVKIPEMPASKNTLIDNTVLNIAYNDVSGTTYQHYTGYDAWDLEEAFLHYNRKEDRDRVIRNITMRGNKKFFLKNYNVDAGKAGDKDLTITTNFTLGDYVQQVKKEYFVNMNLANTFTDMRMNEPDRNFPMYLESKKTIKETVTLNIPKGYRVSYVPKAAKDGVNGLWSYSISYKVDNSARTVTLRREYTLNTMKIMPSQFKDNNRLVDQLKKLYKETVVLTAN